MLPITKMFNIYKLSNKCYCLCLCHLNASNCIYLHLLVNHIKDKENVIRKKINTQKICYMFLYIDKHN